MKEEQWRQLDIFTQRLLIDSWDKNAGKHYGSIRAQLKKEGTPIGNNDLLIAAHARSINAVLVLQQRWFGGFSVTVVFRNKAQYAGNGHSPCQVL